MAKVLSAHCKRVSVKGCLEQHENRSCAVSERRVQDCSGNVCTSQSPRAAKLWEESIWPLNYPELCPGVKPHRVLPHLCSGVWVGRCSLLSG